MPRAERDVVGGKEMAELLGVDRGTPAVWRKRPSAQLPAPDHPPVNGKPAWRVTTIIDWARSTGRWKPVPDVTATISGDESLQPHIANDGQGCAPDEGEEC